MCLWDFSWNFCDVRSIFHAFKQILGFSGIVFALKNNFEKKRKPILSIWAEPEGPTHLALWAQTPAVASVHGGHGQESRPPPPLPWACPAPIKVGSGTARAVPRALARRAAALLRRSCRASQHRKPSRRARRLPPAGLRPPLYAPADGEPSTEFPSSSSLDSTSQSNP
jgi:hypothetical protein